MSSDQGGKVYEDEISGTAAVACNRRLANAVYPRASTCFDIIQQGGAVGFNVKASVAIAGKFDKWDSTLTFTSKMSRQAFWISRCSQPLSIPEAA